MVRRGLVARSVSPLEDKFPQNRNQTNGKRRRTRESTARSQGASQSDPEEVVESDQDVPTAASGSDAQNQSTPDTEDDMSREDEDEKPFAKRAKTNQTAAKLEYRTGGIVRVKLKNFVTYDEVEFFPGPNLNMIIGPNGTGKSTIVCAVALGLGGDPKVLARQGNLHEFVKNGRDKSLIEIELKGGSKNITIRREFKKESNSSTWKLNGQPITERDVKARVASLNIQVDNLCQFLPQDKVCEFAQMDARTLLRQTERAADPTVLPALHDQIIALREEQRTQASALERDRAELGLLERKNAVLEGDVARWREREQLIRQVKVLEFASAVLDFEEYRDTLKKEVLPVYQEAKKNLEEKMAQQEPFQQQRSDATRDVAKAETERDAAHRRAAEALKQLQHQTEQLERLETESDKARNEKAQVISSQAEAIKRVKSLNKEIGRMGEDLEKMRQGLIESGMMSEEGVFSQTGEQMESLRKLEEDFKRINEQLREMGPIYEQMQGEQRAIRDESRQIRDELDKVQSHVSDLQNVRVQRLQLVARADQHAYNAARRVQEMVGSQAFRGKVFGPVCVELTCTNKAFSSAVEATIGRYLQNFVFVEQADYDTFEKEMVTHRLRTSALCFPGLSLNQFQPDVPREEIQRLGFDGYLIDYVTGPPEVIAAICKQTNMHNIPVAVREVHESLSRQFRSYIANQKRYSSTNAYGVTSVRSDKLRPPRFFVDATDNVEAMARFEEQMSDLERKLQEKTEKLKEINLQDQKYRDQDAKLRKQKTAISEKRKELLQMKTKYDHLSGQLEAKKSMVESQEKEIASTDDRLRKADQKLHNVCMKRANMALEHKTLHLSCSKLYHKKILAAMKWLQARAVLSRWEMETEKNAEALREARELFKKVEPIYKNKMATLKEKKRVMDDVTNKHPECADEAREKYLNNDEVSRESVEGMLADAIAQEEISARVDNGVIREYEKRAGEIKDLRKRVENRQRDQESVDSRVADIKRRWKRKLDALITKINDAFSKSFAEINCAGSVELDCASEEYDQWGIKILVKFRENEKLQQLTAQRQSGGERSVTTILYLMALQELSKAPFRVVDEINQGMDPRNERMVHSLMVKIACRPNTSQYFLITPKLLPDLEYHENMRILTVYNGEWLPDHFPYATGITCRGNRRYTSAAA
ncbi:hypothetical protein BJ742DRAFT_814086 [Cladochytrium replicatum]|nr:hypothetical protein BJ742DRAFT_814086 [Cladochytrium replicatum]